MADASRRLASGDRVCTGTGPDRRRLTLEEAEAGALPDRFTTEEWQAMHHTCLQADYDARCRTRDAIRASWKMTS